jgi:hypothetical protein
MGLEHHLHYFEEGVAISGGHVGLSQGDACLVVKLLGCPPA